MMIFMTILLIMKTRAYDDDDMDYDNNIDDGDNYNINDSSYCMIVNSSDAENNLSPYKIKYICRNVEQLLLIIIQVGHCGIRWQKHRYIA